MGIKRQVNAINKFRDNVNIDLIKNQKENIEEATMGKDKIWCCCLI